MKFYIMENSDNLVDLNCMKYILPVYDVASMAMDWVIQVCVKFLNDSRFLRYDRSAVNAIHLNY
jgi:hypothetical protein